jgi:hypothetical protein
MAQPYTGSTIDRWAADVQQELHCAEAFNRLWKAIKLADILDASGWTAQDLGSAPSEAWMLAADIAGTRGPSKETRDLVRTLLTERAYARRVHALGKLTREFAR